MKNNLKYRLSALLFLASALTMTSCSDWTDVESLQLNTPTFEEQNPQLYAYFRIVQTNKINAVRYNCQAFRLFAG